jgi:hypothetical protein
MSSFAVLSPDSDQPVMHHGRGATFLHMSGGEAIIRYWGESHAVAVPPGTLSLPPSGARSSLRSAAHDEPISRDPGGTQH